MSVTPEQWQMWRRLHAAGCPIDLQHLPAPDYPYQVFSPPSKLPSNFFQLKDGVGIVMYLRIVASTSTTICGFRLEADWLASATVRWIDRCLEHTNFYCLPLSTDSHLKVKAGGVLNGLDARRGGLKSGRFLQGLLVGEATGLKIPEGRPAHDATLWIEDIRGKERPYLINLKSGAMPE